MPKTTNQGVRDQPVDHASAVAAPHFTGADTRPTMVVLTMTR